MGNAWEGKRQEESIPDIPRRPVLSRDKINAHDTFIQ